LNNTNYSVLNFNESFALEVRNKCGDSAKCVYDLFCDSINSDYVYFGLKLLIFTLIIRIILLWFVQNNSKYGKFKFMNYDFNEKFDRLVIAYNINSIIYALLGGYIFVWVFMIW